MKTAIFFSIILFFVIVFCSRAEASYVLVSPEKGEGPVQVAERYGVDPAAFIKLNRQLGNFVKPKRPSLIYTWQKFALPIEGVKHEISTQETFIDNLDNLKTKEDVSLKNITTHPAKVVIGEKKLTRISKSKTNSNWPIIATVIMFFVGIFGLLFISLYQKKFLSMLKEKMNFRTKEQLFVVVFSDIFSSYLILPNKGHDIEIEIRKNLIELSECGARLFLKYEGSSFAGFFTYKIGKNIGKGFWRMLTQRERIEFESIMEENIRKKNDAL